MCSLSMFNSFINANSKHTLIWRICQRPSTGPSHVPRRLFGVYVATPLGFEPRITPPKGAVLPLHHGGRGFAILDWRFSIQAQCPKFKRDRPRRSNSLEKSGLNLGAVGRM